MFTAAARCCSSGTLFLTEKQHTDAHTNLLTHKHIEFLLSLKNIKIFPSRLTLLCVHFSLKLESPQRL